MTTETSNARGEAMIAGALFDFLGYLTTRDEPAHFGASFEASPAVELLSAWANTRGLSLDEARVKEWRDDLAAAPPPAAARGDVRGLLRRIDAAIDRVTTGRGHMRVPAEDTDPDLVLADAANWIEAALAAEGVQAGEVECDCPGEGKDDPALHAPNCPARLSQQPEARGVVDGELIEVNGSGSPVDMFLIEAMVHEDQNGLDKFLPDLKGGDRSVSAILTINGQKAPFVEVLRGFFARMEQDFDTRVTEEAKNIVSVAGLSKIEEALREAEWKIERAIDNEDRRRKGRYEGAWNGRAELTEREVLEVRDLERVMKQITISRHYGVSPRAISDICRRKTWTSV